MMLMAIELKIVPMIPAIITTKTVRSVNMVK
jgi:hypothetical protein